MSFVESIILGVVEGFTEFLPISSTAHLILTSKLLGLEMSEFVKSFEISIQLGAILAVVFIYWETLMSKWELNKKIIAAFIPTAIIGLAFYGLIKNTFLSTHLISVYALLIGGVVLILFEVFHRESENSIQELDQISYRNAFVIGLFQSIAIIPGVSRAAATIIGGLTLGISRKTIVEFSFLLAIPTMVAATGLDLMKSAGEFSKSDFISLSIGFAVSFVMAMISVKFLLKYIQHHDFKSFGIYRVIIAVLFLLLI